MPGVGSELTLKSEGISSFPSPKYSVVLRGSGSGCVFGFWLGLGLSPE